MNHEDSKVIRVTKHRSKGLRLPKTLLSKYQLEDEISIELLKDGILIRPIPKSRNGWEKAFKKNAYKKMKDWNSIANRFDREEWTY